MNAPTFTPGPWAVDGMHSCSVWSGDDDPIKVAEAKGVRQADCYRKADDAEREANARLIAAAPELYEALIEAKKALWLESRSLWNLADFNNFAAVQQINAALAKARGDQ